MFVIFHLVVLTVFSFRRRTRCITATQSSSSCP